MKIGPFFSLAVVLIGGFSASAQGASLYQVYTGNFTRVEGLSDDGLTATGYTTNGSISSAFKWTLAGGFTYLAQLPSSTSSFSTDLSADGSVAVGSSSPSSTRKATRWNASGTAGNLGTLSGKIYSVSNGVSSDGSVVVGSSYNNTFLTDALAYRWTSAGGMVSLGDLPGGSTTSQATGVSGDGNVVVGQSSATEGTLAFRWTSTGGMVALGDLAGGAVNSRAFAVSRDGNVVVGDSISANGTEAFRWTAAEGMIGLGDLPGSEFTSTAYAASADGSIIVGVGRADNYNSAFIWDQAHGMRELKSVLETDYGLSLTNWTLAEAQDISSDGKTIAGVGTNPSGDVVGWVAVIPEPGTWNLILISVPLLLWLGFSKNRRLRS